MSGTSITLNKSVTSGIYPLSPPKLRIVNVNTAVATLNDGNTIGYASMIEITFWNVPNVYLSDPQYDLGVELFRRKTRVRLGSSDRHGRSGIVHTVHRKGGLDQAILKGNTSGATSTLNGTDRFTEWSMVGANAQTKLVIDPADSILQFFEYQQFGYLDAASVWNANKYIAYRSGESRLKGYYGTNGLNGIGEINPTGVFYFAYSIFDPNSKRRVRSPLSQPVIVRASHSPTTPAWKDLSFQNGKFRHLNPNYKIESMSFRLGSIGFNEN